MITQEQEESERLKKFIKFKKLNQAMFCEEFKLKKSVVSRYMNGSLKIPRDLIKRIHLKYNLNFNWFFMGTGTMENNKPESKTLVNEITQYRAEIALLESQLKSYMKITDKLVRDFYADRNK